MNLRSLRISQRHKRIDEALRAEQRRVRPDFARISRLKKLKLALKDKLSALNRQPEMI